MKIVIVIPTYNERENLGPLLEELEAQLPGVQHDVAILVVDDNSPDGTGEVALEASQRSRNVHLLRGEKRGLGVAYARGIKHALLGMGAEAVVQMDGDFSHNPADVPRLLAGLDAGADFVIGSRYVKGGRPPDDWGVLRRGVSLAANMGARLIAGLYRIRDCTNGFRAIRSSVLRPIDLERAPRGYAVLLYLIYQAERLGARMHEVPVSFSNRIRGESKLRLRDALEFFINVWWIRYDRPDKFYGRAAGGLSGIIANLATMAALVTLADVPRIVASAVAVEVSVLFSFAWRELFGLMTGRRGISSDLWRLPVFHVLSSPSSLLTLGIFALLSLLLGWHYLIAQAAGIAVALVWNYFVGERLLSLSSAPFMVRARSLWNIAGRQRPIEPS